MNEKLASALGYVDEKHVAAAAKRKNKKPYWLAPVAAVLAIVLLFNAFSSPFSISAKAVSLASESRQVKHPYLDDYKNREEWQSDFVIWQTEQDYLSRKKHEAISSLEPFFTNGSVQFLSSQESENLLWSPVNAYIGLSMLTELTDDASRRQILDLFGARDTDSLRQQVSAVWESSFKDDGRELSTLANSLWLEKGLDYNRDTMDNIAYYYYTSVYQGDLGSKKLNKDIGTWLNDNTEGFLKNATSNIDLSPETVMALYSTICFQSKWGDQFAARNNTDGIFHSADGDKTVIYMNKKLAQMNYYYGDKFGAVALGLKNGSQMWFILPDDGYTTTDVLTDGQYMQMILHRNWDDYKWMKVNLSVPKFDINSTTDLKNGLQKMGVTDIFNEGSACFTELTGDIPIYLTSAKQSVRVQIDEEGVKAAAYIEFPGATSPEPPDEIIDFILDRPFIFAITTDSIPLFIGTVNNP